MIGAQWIVAVEEEAAVLPIFEAGRHEEHMANRDVLKPAIALSELRKIGHDRVIDIPDHPFVDGNAYERGDEGLGDRKRCVHRVAAPVTNVPLEHHLVAPNDY